MSRALRIDPADPRPIWRQIEEGVRHLVASGALLPGAPVPSVRDLARDLQVNPATVSKAYQRLTDAGVLAVKRGEGTYVSETPPELSDRELGRRLLQGAVRYASLAVTLGAGREESRETLDEAWSSLGSGTGEEEREEEEWTSSTSKT
ncbi:MAG TPA: GntR family transcriptional regulator [Thermoanaerobaculia bacterium]|nr:GntR family transcriptional regulator [Thermoanaerobaculia bacterium]